MLRQDRAARRKMPCVRTGQSRGRDAAWLFYLGRVLEVVLVSLHVDLPRIYPGSRFCIARQGRGEEDGTAKPKAATIAARCMLPTCICLNHRTQRQHQASQSG